MRRLLTGVNRCAALGALMLLGVAQAAPMFIAQQIETAKSNSTEHRPGRLFDDEPLDPHEAIPPPAAVALVPEPDSLALFAIGAAALVWWRVRKPRA